MIILSRRVLEHIIPSLIIGLFSFWITGQVILIWVALFTGWLIDADHLFDLWLDMRKDPPQEDLLGTLTTGTYFERNKKIIILFHSWELAFVWFLGWYIRGRIDIGIVGSLAWVVHLSLDQLSYKLSPWAYFLIYRLTHGFARSILCTDYSMK